MQATHLNPKSQLNSLCSKKARRTFQKDDISFSANKFGDQFQATVKLNYYVEPLEFAGELFPTMKAAEQSAAQQALNALALNDGTFDGAVKEATPKAQILQTVAPMPARAGKLMVSPMAAAQAQGASSSPQQQLTFLCGSAIGRQMTAADIEFKVLQFQGQYQATVTLHCKGGAEFAGDLAANPATASNNAATQALQHLMSEDGNVAATMAAVFGAGSAVAALGKKTKKANTPAAKKRKAEGEAGDGEVPGALAQKKQKTKRAIDINLEYSDAKTELNHFVQKKKGGIVTKADVTFEVAAVAGGFQSTVTVVPINSTQFAGDVCPDKKSAEHSAAHAVLKAHEQEILVHNADAAPLVPREKPQPTPKQPKAPKAPKAPKPAKPGEEPVPATKSLAMGLEMMLEHEPTETESFYRTEGSEADGFTSTLSVPCLPGDLATQQWTGDKMPSKAAAEENAAFKALSTLTEHEEVGPVFSSASNMVMMQMMKGKGKGAMKAMAGVMMMNMGMGCMMMKGKGKGGGGGGKKPAGPKEALTDLGQVTGTVKEWKGKFGWIEASKPIEHEQAKKNGGKIYVRKEDLSGDLVALEVGKSVKFSVYTDGKGLGAEKVEVTK